MEFLWNSSFNMTQNSQMSNSLCQTVLNNCKSITVASRYIIFAQPSLYSVLLCVSSGYRSLAAFRRFSQVVFGPPLFLLFAGNHLPILFGVHSMQVPIPYEFFLCYVVYNKSLPEYFLIFIFLSNY